MEQTEGESSEGPLSFWKVYNSVALALFKDLDQAATGLESMMTTIINRKTNIQDIFALRSNTQDNLKLQCVAFNKWFLARLFYILTDQRFMAIHKMSLHVQSLILCVLHSSGAVFYKEIIQDYCNAYVEVCKFYDKLMQEKGKNAIILDILICENIETVLDLTPIEIKISGRQNARNMVTYLHEIMCEVNFKTRKLNLYSQINCTVMNVVLIVYENFDLTLKTSAMRFYVKVIADIGLSSRNEQIETFMNLTQQFVCLLPTLIDICGEDEASNLQEFNVHLKELLDFCYNEEIAKDYSDVVENIIEFILNHCVEMQGKVENKCAFSEEVSNACAQLLDKFVYDRNYLPQTLRFNNIAKVAPSIYINKIMSETLDSYKQGVEFVNLIELSDSFKRLHSVLIENIKEINKESSNHLIFNAHLSQTLKVINVIFDIQTFIHARNKKIEADCEKKVEDNSIKILSSDMCHAVVESLGNALKMHLHKSTQPLKDVATAINILSKTVVVTHNVYMFDLLALIELESFSCLGGDNSNWLSVFFHNTNVTFDKQKDQIQLLKILLTQLIFLQNDHCATKLRETCIDVLDSHLDLSCKIIQVEIIKCSPLLLLNNIYPPEELITKFLYPAFLPNDCELLYELANILPIIVCIISQKFSLRQCFTNLRKTCIRHQLNLEFGMQMFLYCSQCSHKDRNISLDLSSMKITLKNYFNYSESNTNKLKVMLEAFLRLENYVNVSRKDLINLIISFAKHGVIVPSCLNFLLKSEYLDTLPDILGPYISSVLSDKKIEEFSKNEMMNSIIMFILSTFKTSLESGSESEQRNALECVRQFGRVQSPSVTLPCVKMCVGFLMHCNSFYGPTAALYIRDICEAHKTTPVDVYHRYKRDLCRAIIEFAAYNYLVEQECTWCIAKVVRVFGFAKFRDFVSKDIHYALPYLIPLIVKYDKLRAIVSQLASFMNCSVGEFISERFPHVYTYVYITENYDNARKCFEYIEEVTGTQITNLIKKHFRIILTEFLLQYCSGPEKVLEACRSLAQNDPECPLKHSDSSLSLPQVADFIQPRFLGVLAYFDSKLVNSKGAISIKRKALQSFPHILNLMGSQHMTPLRFKILATLRSALTLMSDFPALNAAAWNAFIHNVDTVVLGPLLSTIFVSLLPLLDRVPNEINDIFIYLVVQNENLLSIHIPDLFFIDENNVASSVRQVISKHVQRNRPDEFLVKIKWLLKYLNHDSSAVRVHTFKYLLKLIKDSQMDIHKAFFGSRDINLSIVQLIDVMIASCRDKESKIRELSGRCLGALGAVDPSLLPRYPNSQHSVNSTPFASSITDDHFIKQALIELIRAFHTEKDTKNMDCYALAIQEILKEFDISPKGQKMRLWNSFPDSMHQIMLPLLSSRYILSLPTNTKQVHPIYGSNQAATFSEWAFNWISQIINQIDSSRMNQVGLLKKMQPSLKRDLRTLVLYLPYVVLHSVLTDNDKNIEEEMLAVIGADSFNRDSEGSGSVSKCKTLVTLNFTPNISHLVHEEGTQLKCRKMVYLLLDFLNRWLLEWTHNNKDGYKNDNYIKISKFLDRFCKLTVARGNFLCGELERSLLYLEMYVEGSRVKLHEQLAFLAEIYAVLNEPDCVAGILRMKQSEPSLRELVLAHKVTGQLQDAATCYEKSAQQGDLNDETLQGMVEVYLGLDQPHTALSLLKGANIRANGGLAAEPMWRLGRFEDLDRLLKEPDVQEDRQWGVRVGHCLLAFRKGERQVLENQLCTAREALLRRMGESATSTAEIRRSYTYSYHNALGLHMLNEIEYVESLIFKIKELPDSSGECFVIIDKLIEEWDLRLRLVQHSSKTVEPVLRLRRILLEQSKELLSRTHPQTTASLNSHIGKIWLQSAKFARKASIYQQAYIYILNAEKYTPKELFIEKAKLYWERGQQEPAFYTLERGLEEHFPSLSQLSTQERKICAQAKLLIAMYSEETANVDMDVNISYYKKAVETYKQCEESLVLLAEYYEKVYNALSSEEKIQNIKVSARAQALNCYGKALQYGHTRLYQSMPRMLSIWLDFEVQTTDPKSQTMMTLKQICCIIDTFSKRLPSYLFLTAFSQIISRICHPVKEVYDQLKSIIIQLILAHPQQSLWMMLCVIKSSYPQRIRRCQEILSDPRLKQEPVMKLIYDFNELAEKLIELCNKPIAPKIQTTQVSLLVRTLPKLLTSDNFSKIMMPCEQFIKVVLPLHSVNKELDSNYNPYPHMVYITGIEETVNVFPSLQRPRRITFKGSDGKRYHVMLKPKDDLRKDFRLMEFNSVVNRYLQENSDARERRLYIRTYSVLPLNEECGILEWVDNLFGLRPILVQLYKEKGKFTSPRELKEVMCTKGDPVSKMKEVFETKLLPKHPPVFDLWFRHTFPDPHAWYQARSAYIRTTAVMSMVGYILGLGDRHGENILFDSKNGDTVHVDFNCLFNKGESFEWPERVPFRLTHNMTHAMGPLGYEGMYRKCCEITLRVLKSQTSTLMSVIQPFVYDPLVAWQKIASKDTSTAERTNQLAKEHLMHIKQRLQGMVMTKGKQFSLFLSPEGQAHNLIVEATDVYNLCQMYIGWGPFL